ncbi:MAG: dockerin type I repeat-containing protein [Clostridia bacterium]|nr:dockerin type I repeat-containing protein [Clostridia bacterium]
MKKSLCFLIAVLMLVAGSTLCVSADTLRDEVEVAFSDYCVQFEDHYKEVEVGTIAQDDGVTFFRGYPEKSSLDTWEWLTYVGDWFIYGTSYAPGECSGVYAIVDGVVYPVEQAYEQGIVSDLSALVNFYETDSLLRGPAVYLMGDADYDGALTIKDATAIQKHLVGIRNIDLVCYEWCCDMNRDNQINIKDCTAVQYKLAGITE